MYHFISLYASPCFKESGFLPVVYSGTCQSDRLSTKGDSVSHNEVGKLSLQVGLITAVRKLVCCSCWQPRQTKKIPPKTQGYKCFIFHLHCWMIVEIQPTWRWSSNRGWWRFFLMIATFYRSTMTNRMHWERQLQPAKGVDWNQICTTEVSHFKCDAARLD